MATATAPEVTAFHTQVQSVLGDVAIRPDIDKLVLGLLPIFQNQVIHPGPVYDNLKAGVANNQGGVANNNNYKFVAKSEDILGNTQHLTQWFIAPTKNIAREKNIFVVLHSISHPSKNVTMTVVYENGEMYRQVLDENRQAIECRHKLLKPEDRENVRRVLYGGLGFNEDFTDTWLDPNPDSTTKGPENPGGPGITDPPEAPPDDNNGGFASDMPGLPQLPNADNWFRTPAGECRKWVPWELEILKKLREKKKKDFESFITRNKCTMPKKVCSYR